MKGQVYLYEFADVLSNTRSSMPYVIYTPSRNCEYENELVVAKFMTTEQICVNLAVWKDRIKGAGWNSEFNYETLSYDRCTVFHIPNNTDRLQFQLEFC